jgi:hypothetical protein
VSDLPESAREGQSVFTVNLARMAIEWGEFVRRESVGYWGREQERALERLRVAGKVADAEMSEYRELSTSARYTHQCPVCLLLTEGEETCEGDSEPSMWESHNSVRTKPITAPVADA